MPRVILSFSGWVRGGDITEAWSIEKGEYIDVTSMSAEELILGIKAGRLAISLSHALDSCDKSEVEMFDYESGE